MGIIEKKGGSLDLNVIKYMAEKVVVFIAGLLFIFTTLWLVSGFDNAKAIWGFFTSLFTSICNTVITALF